MKKSHGLLCVAIVLLLAPALLSAERHTAHPRAHLHGQREGAVGASSGHHRHTH